MHVDWGTSSMDNTTVTIVRKNDSDFILYVSKVDGKDKLFVTALEKHWENAQ